jgi:hypothetical protein
MEGGRIECLQPRFYLERERERETKETVLFGAGLPLACQINVDKFG